jgi:hypothetical protein
MRTEKYESAQTIQHIMRLKGKLQNKTFILNYHLYEAIFYLLKFLFLNKALLARTITFYIKKSEFDFWTLHLFTLWVDFQATRLPYKKKESVDNRV